MKKIIGILMLSVSCIAFMVQPQQPVNEVISIFIEGCDVRMNKIIIEKSLLVKC